MYVLLHNDFFLPSLSLSLSFGIHGSTNNSAQVLNVERASSGWFPCNLFTAEADQSPAVLFSDST